MIGVGVIGYGYWGPNLVRNFVELPSCTVVAVCDFAPSRCALVARRHPGVRICSSVDELLEIADVAAVAIATPVSTHFDLAQACLRGGRHVLVEKPLTTSSAAAMQLVEEASRRRLVLMVDHTFLYTPAVRKIREIVQSGTLGQLLYYDSVRINLGLFQHDASVLWDLATHDVAIMDHLLGASPIAVSACGVAHVSGRPESVAYLTFFYPGRLIAHMHVNWLAPVKLRRTLIGGDQRMIVYDDIEATEKVKIYDRGVTVDDDPETVHRMLVNYRMGDVHAPHLETTEALRIELAHFLECVANLRQPLTDGHAGIRVVRCLEAATASIAKRGEPIALDWNA